MASIIFGMVMPWLLVCLGCRLIYLLARQNGRMLVRLEGMEEQLGLMRGLLEMEAQSPAEPTPATEGVNGHAASPVRGKANLGLTASRINRQGLKAGTPAPGFRLPRLDGGELSLEEYCGRCVLLVFSDPECGPCQDFAPRLEQFHRRSADVQVLMVSRRDAESNRRKVKDLGLTFPVVLQRHWQTSLLYGMFATPIAYLIDEHGIIEADVAVGEDAIQALMSSAQSRKEVASIGN